MRFSLFAHMERTAPGQTHAALFAELEQLVQIAEAGGMHAAWIGEHHGMEFTIAPNPFINIAYLGARTSRIRLGTGTIIAPFWHPIRLAGEAALADLACQGRLDLGIARGAYQFEYDRLLPGLDAVGAGRRMRELVPLVRRLWDGDVAHEGEFFSFPATTSVPKPVQQRLPIWLAARDPNSHQFAVAQGCNLQVTPLASGDAEVESLMQRFTEACASHPDMPRPEIMLLMHGYVAEDAADAAQAARELARFYCYFDAWFQNRRPIENGFVAPLSEAEVAAHPVNTPERMARNLVIGTPGTIIDRLKGYERMGYDQFSLWIDSLMPFERKRASLERFIRDVMPAFAA